MNITRFAGVFAVSSLAVAFAMSGAPLLRPSASTAPFHQYEDAPATPDADDPALWFNAEAPADSLVLGTLKDGGLIVFDLQGAIRQAVLPPNAPVITADDPPTPAGLNSVAAACPESEDGETFGRYNNVDIVEGFSFGARTIDLAVVTDRGCDRIRFFEVSADGLVDITSPTVDRVFSERFVNPSPLQPGSLEAGLQDNPLDDQNTGYGLAVWPTVDGLDLFVSQRSRSNVKQLRVERTSDGLLTYRTLREFRFDPTFPLTTSAGESLLWTPCRESADDDPQSEGLVIDPAGSLYVGFEDIGVYRIELSAALPEIVQVSNDALFEPVKSFGRAYWAIPDGDEFECEIEPSGRPEDGTIVAAGTPEFAGQHIEADTEGMVAVPELGVGGTLIVSSQGDNTFQTFTLAKDNRWLSEFSVLGVGDTDGLAITTRALGPDYPFGALIMQNGEAPEPADSSDINGYAYDGSSEFVIVGRAPGAGLVRPCPKPTVGTAR